MWTNVECAKYFLCLEGEVFEFKCSVGLLFDVVRQICDFKANVDNCDVTSGTHGDPLSSQLLWTGLQLIDQLHILLKATSLSWVACWLRSMVKSCTRTRFQSIARQVRQECEKHYKIFANTTPTTTTRMDQSGNELSTYSPTLQRNERRSRCWPQPTVLKTNLVAPMEAACRRSIFVTAASTVWTARMRAGVMWPVIRMPWALVTCRNASCPTASARGMARGYRRIWRGTRCRRWSCWPLTMPSIRKIGICTTRCSSPASTRTPTDVRFA